MRADEEETQPHYSVRSGIIQLVDQPLTQEEVTFYVSQSSTIQPCGGRWGNPFLSGSVLWPRESNQSGEGVVLLEGSKTRGLMQPGIPVQCLKIAEIFVVQLHLLRSGPVVLGLHIHSKREPLGLRVCHLNRSDKGWEGKGTCPRSPSISVAEPSSPESQSTGPVAF